MGLGFFSRVVFSFIFLFLFFKTSAKFIMLIVVYSDISFLLANLILCWSFVTILAGPLLEVFLKTFILAEALFTGL
jgi:hypothetical protein